MLLSRNVVRRLWKLFGKASHHNYNTRDHCQGSCSIIVDRRVQSITLSQGVSSLDPKVSWTWSEMNSAQLVMGEWQLSFLRQFVTTDETWVHHFQLEMVRAVERFSAFQESEDNDVCQWGNGLYFIGCKRSVAVGLPKKGYTVTRASIDKKGALQPEQSLAQTFTVVKQGC